MRPVSGAVGRLLRALGIAPDVARADAVRAWPAVAAGVIGPDAARTRALHIDEEGALVVAVPTTQWAAEIRLRESELLRGVRSRAPRSGVRRIRSVPDAHKTPIQPREPRT